MKDEPPLIDRDRDRRFHIWQEFERDQNTPRERGEPFWGRGWLLLPMVLLLIAVLSYAEISGGPAWLLAITRLFY